jgi:DNA helicase-2/ATP-dependent DNA helicase PcrA
MLKELYPSYKSYDVLDDAKRVAFLAKYRNFKKLNLFPLRHNKNTGTKLGYYKTIYKFLYSVDLMMMEDIDPNDLTNKHFAESYKEYVALLKREKYLDFPSMIYELITRLRKDKKMLARFNEQIKHLIVDEYQDVNKTQEELIRLISLGAESICVVGDDDQCIYQWRGSNVENIIEFKNRYGGDKKVSDYPLQTNFRSTEAIIHTASEFIKNNKNRLDFKTMKHNDSLQRKYEKGDIIYNHFDDESQEFAFIADKIEKELLGTDFVDKKNNPFSLSLGDFAVLVRTNDDAARIIKYFDDRGIDCIAYSGESVFKQPEVEFAMDCIAYIFKCKGYTTAETPLLNALKTRYSQLFKKSDYPKADPDKFVKRIEAIKVDMDKIRKKGKKDYLGDRGLQAVYHRLLSAFGAEDFEFDDVYNYNLAVLSTAVSDYESVWIRLRTVEVQGFFWFVRAFAEGHYMGTQHSDTGLINAVKVITIHKAKGLEFPVVFIPGLVNKRKPNAPQSFVDQNLYPYERYAGTTEDERRTLYTAITRSEKYLFMTGASRRPNRSKTYGPHPFIDELDKKYFSTELSTKRKASGYPVRGNTEGIYPTSFSELTCFDRCPHDFKLRHVFGYNAGVPVTFGYGTNIHNILNVIHKEYIQDGRLPDEEHVDELFDRDFKLRYATDKISENMKKTGKLIVKNYVKLHTGEFTKILETEKNFEFVLDEAIISGQIDLLKEVDDSGKVVGVEIIDFKTEKKDGVYKLDHEKQLRFYALACMKSLGLNPKKACVHHLDKNRNIKDYVDISEPQLESTKKIIRNNVKTILKKQFKAKPSKVCKECDYKFVCPHKGRCG